MYQIKQIPEDFQVIEISSIELQKSGQYSIVQVKKANHTTIEAAQLISRALNIKLRDVGYAGSKDKKAITTQLMSIKNKSIEQIKKLKFNNIQVKHVGYNKEPVSLGDLEGNSFIITIRNIENTPKIIPKQFINYFGEQRFSSHNVEIGLLLLKQQWKEALSLIQEHSTQNIKELDSPVNTLKQYPTKLLLIYIHAVQSYIWNKTAEYCIKNRIKTKAIPIIGFGVEPTKQLDKIMNLSLNSINITPNNFLMRPFPELSAEGGERGLIINIKDFKLQKKEDDDLNPGKNKIIASFTLPKGSYATELIRQWLNKTQSPIEIQTPELKKD